MMFFMQPDFHRWVGWLWLAVAVIWVAGLLVNRQTIRRDVSPFSFLYRILAVAAWLLCFGRYNFGILEQRFIPDTSAIGWFGFSLNAIGVIFAIAARFYIGRNWSSAVTIKQDHTLIRTGPYALVRHPIYSGFILGLIGTALVQGEWKSLLGVACLFCGFWIKASREEKFMVEQFGDQYVEYRRQVRRLVPFVL